MTLGILFQIVTDMLHAFLLEVDFLNLFYCHLFFYHFFFTVVNHCHLKSVVMQGQKLFYVLCDEMLKCVSNVCCKMESKI